jgi:hypothetical protein
MADRYRVTRRILVLIALCTLGDGCADKMGKAASEAQASVSRVAAAVQTGTAYPDYLKLLADAQLHMRTYLESAEARRMSPDFTMALRSALLAYTQAAMIWSAQQKADTDYGRKYLKIGDFGDCAAAPGPPASDTASSPPRDEECIRGKELIAAVPDIAITTAAGTQRYIVLDDALRSKWQVAAENLALSKNYAK